MIVVALLLYSPLNAQRRFVEGGQIPLTILATIGLSEAVPPRVACTSWFQALAQRPGYTVNGVQRLLVVLGIGFVSSASVYLYLSTIFTTAVMQPYPFFRPVGE